MKEVTEEWIRRTDDIFHQQSMPIRARPMKAWERWSIETGPSRMDSPEARTIFDWYKANYPPGSFDIGSLFAGAFFFDQAVWPLHVPIGYGTFVLAVNRMVEGMTSLIGDRLSRNSGALNTLSAVAMDCIDYAYGFDDLRSASLASAYARDLLSSADKELRASVEVLLSKGPSQKVAESAALAVEMFFKCFLAQYTGLDDAGAKKINHDLDEGLKRCLAHEAKSDLGVLVGTLGVLPKIGDRYVHRNRPLNELWYTYSLAQVAGSAVVRSLSGRDCRPTMKVDFPPKV